MDDTTSVFFYGLFMDESLLASMDIRTRRPRLGHVEGFGLQIGERATLVREHDSRAYGVLMELAADQLAALYADQSVRDYVPEPVVVHLQDGAEVTAVCYNLPASELTGANPTYAAALLALASRLGMPESYLARIRSYTGPG